MSAQSTLDLGPMLAPGAIAVIGASQAPGNLGGVAIALMRKLGYPGRIYPVNPGRSDIHGLKCYPSIASLPQRAELAILATAAERIPDLVRECAAAGTRHGIVWAGGFAEVGPAGKALQDRLVAACRETNFLLMGPNSIGLIDSHAPVIASFASFLTEIDRLEPGAISMVSQSGGLATMSQAIAQQAGFGFRYMISSGNEAVLSISDYLEALASDEKTRVVAAYLEGVRDGPRFLAALEHVRRAGKPMVVLKGGTSEASARAAASHTGALVGASRVWDAILREQAVIKVGSQEALNDTCLLIASLDPAKLPKGSGVAAVSFGGGSGVLSADQCADNGLLMPRLQPRTRQALQPLVPPIAGIDNPIDLTPLAFNQPHWLERLPAALDTIAADPQIDIVLLQFGPMARGGPEVANAVCEFRRRCPKTVAVAWPLAPSGIAEILKSDGVHVFDEPARAIAALGRLSARDTLMRRAHLAPPQAREFDWAGHIPAPAGGLTIPEDRCHRLLQAAGLTVAAGELAQTADEAAAVAARIGFPVALKGISPAVPHRAAAGLLAVGLRSQKEVRQAFASHLQRADKIGVALDGCYVQAMVKGEAECLLSAFRDAMFGPMISVGAGGSLTELIDDVAIARAPLSTSAARDLLADLRIVKAAARAAPQLDIGRLADYVARLSVLAAGAPYRRFLLEVNPVEWGQDHVTAVDGLLVIEEV